MRISCLRIAILAAYLLPGCTHPPGTPAAHMQPDPSSSLALTATQLGGPRPLAAEEGADFDLILQNQGTTAQTVQSLENDYTPVYEIYDSSGHELGKFNAHERTLRTVGDIGTAESGEPDEVTLEPGNSVHTWARLWAFRDPLPPGRYAFQAQHETVRGASPIQSNRATFTILPARVKSVAVAPDSPSRANSVLAWLAQVDQSPGLRLLIRQSGFSSHKSVQVGGIASGDFPEGSRVALSAMPMDAQFSPLNWVAVLSGPKLQMIQHGMAVSRWRAPVMTLPASDAVPMPRFPNRQHAVFLATGTVQGGPALIGVVVTNGGSSPAPWTVRLRGLPTHAACAFSMAGPITVLYATDDRQTSRLYRLHVSEDGGIAAPEAMVYESPNRVLAVATDMRLGQPASFVVVEADRTRHNNLGFIKVPLAGNPMAMKLHEYQGWPMRTNVNGTGTPLPTIGVDFDLDATGMPWLAVVSENGELVGGRLDGSLQDLRENKNQHCSWPQVAGLADNMTLSCFLDNGMLLHHRIGGDDH